jgi:UDP-N-acetylglucosamine acyltransferase
MKNKYNCCILKENNPVGYKVTSMSSCASSVRKTFDAHPTSSVHESAIIGVGCVIGPYCIIGPGVVLHERVWLDSHVVIQCNTSIGSDTHVRSFAVVGGDPQHTIYAGQATHLIIGANVQIREHVTIHRGTVEGGGTTRIGDRVLLMVGVHIAHDCIIGNDVVMANQATLGGHVQVGDHAVLGGLCAIHQFTRIGEGAMVSGFSGISTDVIPYGLVFGYRAKLTGINRVKLKRLQVAHDEIHAIKAAVKWIFEENHEPFNQRVQTLSSELVAFPRVQAIQEFLTSGLKRPICMLSPENLVRMED